MHFLKIFIFPDFHDSSQKFPWPICEILRNLWNSPTFEPKINSPTFPWIPEEGWPYPDFYSVETPPRGLERAKLWSILMHKPHKMKHKYMLSNVESDMMISDAIRHIINPFN